jgi:hypothetical protein
LLALVAALILICWYRFKDRINTPAWLTRRVSPICSIIVVSFFFTNNHKLQFCILSVSLCSHCPSFPTYTKVQSREQRARLWLLYMMALVPTLFLILMSFKNGHTYGITQRYSGFSFPLYDHSCEPVAAILCTTLQAEFRVLIFVFLAAQLYFVGLTVKRVL